VNPTVSSINHYNIEQRTVHTKVFINQEGKSEVRRRSDIVVFLIINDVDSDTH